ncbi:MAG: SGNH/GDSL hydrolase family protein [Ilumatobacteraceae bacterium]
MAILFLVYSIVTAVFAGPSPSTEAAPTAPSTSLVVGDASATPLTTASTSTSTTELQPKEKTVPTAANPAVLYVAGDSDAGTFGPYLEKLMKQTGMVKTTLDYKVSSGLSRPDFFDWPTYFAQQIPAVNPDIVVVTFGGNDAQGLRNVDKTWAVQHSPGSGGDDTDWRAEYAKRVGAVMDYLGGDNRTLIWVGIPNDNSPDNTARLQVQNEVVVAEAAKRPKVVFIDTWKRFTGLSGGYADFVQDPRDGQFKPVRRSDGFHLNTTGAEILALDIAEAIRTELRARGGAV